MELISMTDFVLSRDNSRSNSEEALYEITQYANFLKQPLKLEMFVPYDENHGGVLKKPCDEELEKFKGLQYGDFDCNYTYIFDYNQAKEKVLFEGFNDIEAINYHISRNRTIEYLSKFGTLKLTSNAIKQFL